MEVGVSISVQGGAILESSGAFERNRLRATGHVCRVLRHDLAKPLNASVLHLEVASRGLARLSGDGVEAIRASVRTSQAEVERAGRMIDVLSELSRRVEAAAERLDLGRLLAQAVGRAKPGLSARGLSVVEPRAWPEAWILGSAADLEEAVEDLLSGVAAHAVPGECAVTFDKVGAEATLTVRVPVRPPAPAPESLFGPSSHAGGTGPDGSLLLVRWTFESLGGGLRAAAAGSSLVLTAVVPLEIG